MNEYHCCDKRLLQIHAPRLMANEEQISIVYKHKAKHKAYKWNKNEYMLLAYKKFWISVTNARFDFYFESSRK